MSRKLAFASLLAATAACGASSQAPVRTPSRSFKALVPAPLARQPLMLGVGTHFAQGWSPNLVDQVHDSHAASVRDTVAWDQIETTPGRYDFPRAKGIKSLERICRSGVTLLLMLDPRNPLYDGGQAVHGARGIAAYAAYVGSVARHFGRCLIGIEIGNEINDPHNLPYPDSVNRAAVYVMVVRSTRAALAAQGFAGSVVAGDTNAIGTGFLDGLFTAGLLDAADAVSVHPYRSQAENVDIELAHLRETMRRHGHELPIWVTEFSDNYKTPELAADELVKAVTLLGTAGVANAYWYALVDQPWFRNMGLYTPDGGTKPAALAFRTMAGASARPVRVDLGDEGIRLYRIGDGQYLLWGTGGSVAFAGHTTASDSRGRPISVGAEGVAVGPAPLVVTATGTPRRSRASNLVADSLFGYGRAPWSYLARVNGTERPLALIDSNWTSSFASPYLRPLEIFDQSAIPAGTGAAPQQVVIRYTAPSAQRLSISACFHKDAKGDGADLAVNAAGRPVWQQVLTQDAALTGIDVDLAAGATLDLVAGPNQAFGDDAFSYRLQLFRRDAARPTPCPQRPSMID